MSSKLTWPLPHPPPSSLLCQCLFQEKACSIRLKKPGEIMPGLTRSPQFCVARNECSPAELLSSSSSSSWPVEFFDCGVRRFFGFREIPLPNSSVESRPVSQSDCEHTKQVTRSFQSDSETSQFRENTPLSSPFRSSPNR